MCVLLQLIARCCCWFEVEAAAAKVDERKDVNADVSRWGNKSRLAAAVQKEKSRVRVLLLLDNDGGSDDNDIFLLTVTVALLKVFMWKQLSLKQ
jgi:hypothetical protein